MSELRRDQLSRDSFSDDASTQDGNSSTNRWPRRATQVLQHGAAGEGGAKQVFIDVQAMKERVRANLSKPQYNVANFYKDRGCWQTVARSIWFEHLTLGVIGINAAWLAVDTDHNDAEILLEAHPIFQGVENFFCTYFVMELFVRFMAFQRKWDGLKDAWFTFDSALVFMMVLETWVMTFIILLSGSSGGGGLGNASILRIARLLRLSRMARMARLLRAMPELMTLIKGMVAACRSVFFTLCLLTILMYIFAIAFTQLTIETNVGKSHFKSVPDSMYTLLLYGTLLDDIGVLSSALGKDSAVLGAIFFIFVLLAALTVMNMLIGVLCEVVSAVAATERETMLVGYVSRKVQKIVQELDENGDGHISKVEFMQILESLDASRALQEVGVDVEGLVDFADIIFEESQELSFQSFMEIVLQLRGSNTATVKDIVELRKLVRTSAQQTQDFMARVVAEIKVNRKTIQKLGISSQGSLEAPAKTAHKDDRAVPSGIPSRRNGQHRDAAEAVAPPRMLAAPVFTGSSRPSGESISLEEASPVAPTMSAKPCLMRQDSDLSHWSFGSERQASGSPALSPRSRSNQALSVPGAPEEVLPGLRGPWSPVEGQANLVARHPGRPGEDAERLSNVTWESDMLNTENQASDATGRWDLQCTPGAADAWSKLGSRQIEYCPIPVQELRGQITKLARTLTVSLSEVKRIQHSLSHCSPVGQSDAAQKAPAAGDLNGGLVGARVENQPASMPRGVLHSTSEDKPPPQSL